MPDPVMRTQPEKYPARYIIYAGPGHADAAREIPCSLYNLYRARPCGHSPTNIPHARVLHCINYRTGTGIYNETITQFRVRAMTCYLAALVW